MQFLDMDVDAARGSELARPTTYRGELVDRQHRLAEQTKSPSTSRQSLDHLETIHHRAADIAAASHTRRQSP